MVAGTVTKSGGSTDASTRLSPSLKGRIAHRRIRRWSESTVINVSRCRPHLLQGARRERRSHPDSPQQLPPVPRLPLYAHGAAANDDDDSDEDDIAAGTRVSVVLASQRVLLA
jgi:hypothetical protein